MRKGRPGYAIATRMFIDHAMDMHAFMERSGIQKNAAQIMLPAMHAMGLLHIEAWSTHPRRVYMPVYRFGEGVDAPFPALRPNGKPCQQVRRRAEAIKRPVELISYAATLEELTSPSTAAEIAAACGTQRIRTRDLLLLMHELRIVRIASWQSQPTGGVLQPRYVWAVDGKDASKPSRKELTRIVNARYFAAAKQRRRMQQIQRALAGNSTPYREAVAA